MGAADGFVAALRATGMPMHLDVRGVDHQPFEIGFADHGFGQALPNSFVAPAAEPAVGVVPVSLFGRQATPRRTGSQHPNDGVDEEAIIFGYPAPIAWFPRQEGSEDGPSPIGDVVAVQGASHGILRRQRMPEILRNTPAAINHS